MKKFIVPLFLVSFTSCDMATKPKTESVVFNAPESKPQNFNTTDSSYLRINIKGDKFETEFLKKMVVLNTLNSLDSFLQINNGLIHDEKVIVSVFDTANKNKGITAVLQKHGITKFAINTY